MFLRVRGLFSYALGPYSTPPGGDNALQADLTTVNDQKKMKKKPSGNGETSHLTEVLKSIPKRF